MTPALEISLSYDSVFFIIMTEKDGHLDMLSSTYVLLQLHKLFSTSYYIRLLCQLLIKFISMYLNQL